MKSACSFHSQFIKFKYQIVVMFTSWLRVPKLFFISIPKTQVVVNTPDLIVLFQVRRCRESKTRQRCMQYVIRKVLLFRFFFIQEGGRSYPSGKSEHTTKQTLFLMICPNLNLISRCTVSTLYYYKLKLNKNMFFICHVDIFTYMRLTNLVQMSNERVSSKHLLKTSKKLLMPIGQFGLTYLGQIFVLILLLFLFVCVSCFFLHLQFYSYWQVMNDNRLISNLIVSRDKFVEVVICNNFITYDNMFYSRFIDDLLDLTF